VLPNLFMAGDWIVTRHGSFSQEKAYVTGLEAATALMDQLKLPGPRPTIMCDYTWAFDHGSFSVSTATTIVISTFTMLLVLSHDRSHHSSGRRGTIEWGLTPGACVYVCDVIISPVESDEPHIAAGRKVARVADSLAKLLPGKNRNREMSQSGTAS
jgi:hypothetical protein